MAPQSLYISNLAVSFSTKVQDAYCQLSLGGSSVRTSILGTNSSRQVHMLNWVEDLQLQYDPANPGHREIQVDVCSQGGAGRVGGPIATCTLPLNLGSGRQEINKPLRAQVRQYNNGTLSCLLHSDESRGVRDGSHHYNVGAVPGYTTGHVDQNAMGGSFTGTMGGMSQGGVTGGMAGAKTWGPQPGYNNTLAPAGNLKAPGTVQAPLAVPQPGGLAVGQTAPEAVCHRDSFTSVEPRPLVKETTRFIREHRPFQKEFVTEVRYVGERELPDRLSMEHLKTEERVVEETHTAPCSPFNCGDCAGGQQAYAANTVGPRKANFAPPARPGSAYTGLGASRTAKPMGADLGNWSTTYSNSYEDPQVGTLARSRYGGPGARPVVGAYKQQVAAPQAAYGSTYAPRSYNATAGYNAGSQNFTIKAAAQGTPGDFVNPHGPSDLVCNREFFTMTEDRPLVKEVKDYVREHHFFEKAFVKETRFTGKEQQAGTGESEQLSCEERVVEATPAAPPCQGCGDCAC
eukprot:jgi/Astpho2/5557/Aster-x0687